MNSRPEASMLQLADLDLPTLVSLLGSAVDRRVMGSLSAAGLHGLRTGHGHVVQRLINGPSTVGEIAESIGVTQQAVSKTVKELVALGYVERARDSSDARRRPVSLTRSGRKAVTTARRARASLHDDLVDAFPPRDLDVTRRVLEQLAQTLGLEDDVARRVVPPPAEWT